MYTPARGAGLRDPASAPSGPSALSSWAGNCYCVCVGVFAFVCVCTKSARGAPQAWGGTARIKYDTEKKK